MARLDSPSLTPCHPWTMCCSQLSRPFPEVKVDDVVYRDVKEEEGEDAVVVPEEALLQEEKSPLTADELHAQ